MSNRLGQLNWSLSETNPAPSSRRCLRYSLSREQATSFVLVAASRRGLRVAGFRQERAPAKLVYAHHQRICDGEIVAQLRRDQPSSLAEALCKALTPPEYKAAPWDGESEFHVEVSYFEQPAAPDPAAAFGQPEGLAADLIPVPKPGAGLSVADFLPPALQAQGVLTGLHLQAGLGREDQPKHHMETGALGSSGLALPDPGMAAHLPGLARNTPGQDPRPAPAVPHASLPEPDGPRPAPGGAARAAPELTTTDVPRARTNPPHVASRTPQPVTP